MVLYDSDFKKYGVYVHVNTRNHSFLRLSGIYKKMGIKNHKFLLALHNPNLAHIDPHDPDLGPEIIAMISEEIAVNPWYYFREIARAPSISGHEVRRFQGNRGNIAMLWLFFNHITTYLVQIRQTGKSFSMGTLARFLLNGGSVNTEMNLLTKDRKLRTSTVNLIKNMEGVLPDYLKMTRKSDPDNGEWLGVGYFNNTLKTHIGPASAEHADNVARGLTSPIFFIDEFPYIYNIETILPVALAAGGAARDAAKRTGSYWGTLFTTTASTTATKSGKYAHKIYKRYAPWTERFLDAKDPEDLKRIIRLNSPGTDKKDNVGVRVFFNHRQLGYTDEWLKEKIREAEAEGEKIETDFLGIWVTGDKESALDVRLLDLVKSSIKPEICTTISDYGYVTRWYITEDEIEYYKENKHVILGLDTSDAVGKDDIGFVLRDVKTGRTIATGAYNETNIITFSKWLVDFIKSFKKILVIIERKSSGVAIIDYLVELLPLEGIDPYKVLFNWVVDEAQINPKRFDLLKTPLDRRSSRDHENLRKEIGYATSGAGRSSRDNLYGALLSAVKYTGRHVFDRNLAEQIIRLRVKQGRIDHRSGEHDDLVIAWLLTYYVLTKGRNLEFYGIEKRHVLASVLEEKVNNKDLEYNQKVREQEELRDAINILLDYLKNEENDNRAAIIQNRINMLKKDIDHTIIKSLNIEAMIDETIKLRQKNKNSSRLRSW